MIRDKLIKKYNLYYTYWIDYTILTAFLAMIGLIISCDEWENLYPKRYSEQALDESNVFSELGIASISLLGVFSIVIKYRMEATWRHFNNPMRFYRRILRQQVNLGLADKNLMNIDMVHRGNPFTWMMTRPLFWLEIFIIIIIPLPMGDGATTMMTRIHSSAGSRSIYPT